MIEFANIALVYHLVVEQKEFLFLSDRVVIDHHWMDRWL
jgi:hypothetical protein